MQSACKGNARLGGGGYDSAVRLYCCGMRTLGVSPPVTAVQHYTYAAGAQRCK